MEDENGGKEFENVGKVVKEVVFVGEKDEGGEYAVQNEEEEEEEEEEDEEEEEEEEDFDMVDNF